MSPAAPPPSPAPSRTGLGRVLAYAVFLDRQRRVVKTYRRLPRWIGLVPLVWGADSVLELPAGTADGLDLKKGDEVLISPL